MFWTLSAQGLRWQTNNYILYSYRRALTTIKTLNQFITVTKRLTSLFYITVVREQPQLNALHVESFYHCRKKVATLLLLMMWVCNTKMMLNVTVWRSSWMSLWFPEHLTSRRWLRRSHTDTHTQANTEAHNKLCWKTTHVSNERISELTKSFAIIYATRCVKVCVSVFSATGRQSRSLFVQVL